MPVPSSRGVFGLKSKLALALLITAALPFGASMCLSARLADEPLSLGLNPEILTSLEDLSMLYPELFRTRRALAEARADFIALHPGLGFDSLQSERSHQEVAGAFQQACESDPHLRGILLKTQGTTIEHSCGHPTSGPLATIELVRDSKAGELRLTFGLNQALRESHEQANRLSSLYARLEAERDSVSRAYRRSFLVMLGAWALLSGVAGFLVATHATRRVAALAEATRRVSSGDLEARVEVGGSDELSELSHAFNQMVEELAARGDRIVYLEKISSWQEMARRLAHEIKNPLTPIQLAMQQLENRWRKTGGNDPHFGRLLEESLQIVREEIDTLGRLVGEFSAFARLPDVSPEPTDVVRWTRDFIRTHPDLAEKAAILFESDGDGLVASMDRTMMRRVMANLIQNSIDSAESLSLVPTVSIDVSRIDKHVRIRVSDNGPGISHDALERIFDPYFTTKPNGTGLGLTICKKIVLQHGGNMTAAAPPNGGAIFEVRLPTCTAPSGLPGGPSGTPVPKT